MEEEEEEEEEGKVVGVGVGATGGGGAVAEVGEASPVASCRAFPGNSCSAKKGTSSPLIRNTFFSRSIHA